MQLTKTTTRAFAASLALVAAGGTIAGAAVFHLPILGFGRADAASANGRAAAAKRPLRSLDKAQPKVIVKTRYVDVIVHVPHRRARRAPPGRRARSAVGCTYPAIGAVERAPTTRDREPPSPSPPTTTTIAVDHDDDRRSHDDDGEHE